MHLEKLIEICHSVGGTLIDPYMDRIRDEVCACCPSRPTEHCPCAMEYLLPLAVSAIETVDARRHALGERMARAFCDVQDTD